ncbi:MAG: DUF2085 domain-containing protein [Caldilineaceae bacterium]|nr:DUF2085 domain-containing protein [Caldilineaceae bacterium]
MTTPTTDTLSPTPPPPTPPPTPPRSRLVVVVDGLIQGIARHWLAIFNGAWGLYLFFPLVAPVLMALGWYTPARLIYALYSFTCHQLPDHSYFLFGADPVPLIPTLEAGGMAPHLDLVQRRQFIGNEALGFKVAICQRDLAIYAAVFLAGLTYAFLRPRLRQLRLWVYLILVLPIAIDGLTQLVGLRESNWELRTLTGALFGAASVWFAYPYVDDAMQEVLTTIPPHRSTL